MQGTRQTRPKAEGSPPLRRVVAERGDAERIRLEGNGSPGKVAAIPTEMDESSRGDLLAAFLADTPPRRVPKALRRAVRRQSSSWALSIFGFLFGAFGLFFVVQFFPWNFYRDWQLRGAPTAPGRIVSVAPTKLRENKQRVYRYEFSFTPPSGVAVSGTCFTTGSGWPANARIAVRYRPENPALCCVDGARSSVGSGSAAIVLLFPAIGFGLAGWTVVSRRRRDFLEHGELAEARVISLEATATRVNNQTVFRITLQRTDRPGTAPLVVHKYESAQVSLARERMESEQPLFMLLDPAHPKRLLLPEALL